MPTNETTRYSMNLGEDGSGSITVIDLETGDHQLFTSEHPDFPKVVTGVYENLSLAEIRDSIPEVETLMELSEHVTIDDDKVVYFKGEPIHSVLGQTIGRYYNEGRPFEGLVKFMERVELNPSRRSREQLYDWATRAGLEINEDGHIIGYKSVREDYTSVNGSGGAYVDGVYRKGHVPNEIGSVVSMDRRDVQDDPSIECSHGLHVGTLTYALGFSGDVKLVVTVDPADVVSVPSYDHSKMRTCCYTVQDVYHPQVSHEAAPIPGRNVMDRMDEIVPKSFMDRLKAKIAAARES